MKKLKLVSVLKIFFNIRVPCFSTLAVLLICASIMLGTHPAEAKLYIDITSPSMKKISIAVPDFKNMGMSNTQEDFGSMLCGIIANDFDLSGYFDPLDKKSFVEGPESGLTQDTIRFRDWTVIGADFLLKGGYECTGEQLKVELRLYDVFSGRQIYGKRAFGLIKQSRYLMHRLANDIILTLTGHSGPFMTNIAFVGASKGKKEIYVCDFDGYNRKQITGYNTITLSPRWLMSGEKMIYTSFRDCGTVLFMHEMRTGAVAKLSDRKGLNIAAAWRPNGQEIALTLTISGNPDIYLIDLAGKIVKRLTDNWGIDVSPTFSPDGNKMAFVSNRSGSPQIYILDLNTNQVERLTFDGNYNTSPSWSAINRIAFSGSSNGHFQICTITPNGNDLKQITNGQGNNEDPCWSPDGRYIAFSSDRNGGNYHVYIANANGQNQKQVTFFEGDQLSPSWAEKLQ